MAKRIYALDTAKAAACLLITNSHCSAMYPSSLFAIGGSQGNTIFFIISGFLLSRTVQKPFKEWIIKRYLRIIPQTIIVIVMWLLFRMANQVPTLGIVELFLEILNQYWFIWAICIFYPVYYAIMRQNKIKHRYIAFVYLAIYFISYILFVNKNQFTAEAQGFHLYKILNYFGVMLFGGLLNDYLTKKRVVKNNFGKEIVKSLSLFLLGIAIYASEYAVIIFLKSGLEYQFLIHLGNCLFGIGLLEMLLIYNSIHSDYVPSTIVERIASSTLEIYLIQVSILFLFKNMVFPIGLLLFYITVIGLGLVLQKSMNLLQRVVTVRRCSKKY